MFANVVNKVLNMLSVSKAKDKFRTDLATVKQKDYGLTNKQVAIKSITQQMIDQCTLRDESSMCNNQFGLSGKCDYTCSGPVEKQPEICGFNAAFNYKLVDQSETVSDLCTALEADGLITKPPSVARSPFFVWFTGRFSTGR